jgi:hypothetical protein
VTPQQKRDYNEMLKEGVAPQLAEMLALQQPPGVSTDTRFLAGHNGNEFYSHQLASFPGDPDAVVSSRADVQRVAERKGMYLEGTYGMGHEPPGWGQAEEEQPYRVAEDIVEDALADAKEEHPGIEHDIPDLKEKLTDQLSGGDRVLE